MEHEHIERELQRLHPETFGWALACCGRHRSNAEDVVQLTYLKVLDGRAVYHGRSSFRSWLFGVIRLTALERQRRSAWRERLLTLWTVADGSDPDPDPESATELSTQSQRLLAALAQLSPRQAQVLQLAFYHDMTLQEAADVMGLSLGSARTHYARGKQRLAALLHPTDGANRT